MSRWRRSGTRRKEARCPAATAFVNRSNAPLAGGSILPDGAAHQKCPLTKSWRGRRSDTLSARSLRSCTTGSGHFGPTMIEAFSRKAYDGVPPEPHATYSVTLTPLFVTPLFGAILMLSRRWMRPLLFLHHLARAAEFGWEVFQLRQAVPHGQHRLSVIDVNAGGEGKGRDRRGKYVHEA
jgi:hypothetical protein